MPSSFLYDLWRTFFPAYLIIRHVHNTGHWGTGDVEVIIRDAASFANAKVLIERAYQEN